MKITVRHYGTKIEVECLDADKTDVMKKLIGYMAEKVIEIEEASKTSVENAEMI